jgi:hypothetical protein
LILRHALSVIALSALAACSSSAPPVAVTTRDSAGVTVIEHPAGAIDAAPEWTVGRALLTISHGPSAEEGFSWIANAARLGDGSILLLDSQDDGTLAYLYDTAGAFVRQLARTGMGPGELMYARLMSVSAGDTLLFYDPRTSRLTSMLPTGTVIGTTELARYGTGTLGLPAGALTGARLIAARDAYEDTTDHGGAPYRRPAPLLMFDPATERLDTLSREFPGDEVAVMVMEMGGQSRPLHTPVGYGSSSFILPVGTELHIAANESSALDTYTLPFALRRSVRFAGPRPPVDEDAKEALRDAALANLERMGPAAAPMRKQFDEMMARAQYADSLPWYQGIARGSDGAVWLRQGTIVSDSVPHYLVIGADGALAARVDLPRGARLLWVGADQLLLSLTDGDDVPRLELRPIRKP